MVQTAIVSRSAAWNRPFDGDPRRCASELSQPKLCFGPLLDTWQDSAGPGHGVIAISRFYEHMLQGKQLGVHISSDS